MTSFNTLTEFKEGFAFFDKNNQGWISVDKLGEAMRYLGQNPSEEELSEIIREKETAPNIKEEDKGKIELTNFLALMTFQNMKSKITEDDLEEAFKCFDKDLAGTISTEELAHVLTSMGEKFTQQEVDEMLKDAEQCIVTGNQIDYHQYAKLLLQPTKL